MNSNHDFLVLINPKILGHSHAYCPAQKDILNTCHLPLLQKAMDELYIVIAIAFSNWTF